MGQIMLIMQRITVDFQRIPKDNSKKVWEYKTNLLDWNSTHKIKIF